ncbi:MAG: hypothetical protein IPJ65_24735 [Archangiaceae bacterium]|nr:hypothetical protein [Archangiaceae bacterium]
MRLSATAAVALFAIVACAPKRPPNVEVVVADPPMSRSIEVPDGGGPFDFSHQGEEKKHTVTGDMSHLVPTNGYR